MDTSVISGAVRPSSLYRTLPPTVGAPNVGSTCSCPPVLALPLESAVYRAEEWTSSRNDTSLLGCRDVSDFPIDRSGNISV